MQRLIFVSAFCFLLSAFGQSFTRTTAFQGSAVKKTTGVTAPTPDILWWKMTEGAGTELTNVVGVRGFIDADWVTGPSGSGYALEFNGSSDDARTSTAGSTPSNLTFGTNIITIVFRAWFDATNVDQSIYEHNSSMWSGTSRVNVYIAGEDGALVAAVRGTSGAYYLMEAITAPNTGAWNHFVVVADNSSTRGNFKFYVNAVEKTDEEWKANKDTAAEYAANPVYVGARNGGASLWFDGKLAGLAVYSGELSQAQITALYNSYYLEGL